MLMKFILILGFAAVFFLWLHSIHHKPRIKREILEILDRDKCRWWNIRDIANASSFLTYNDTASHIGELVLERLVMRKEPRPGEPVCLDAALFQITRAGIRHIQDSNNNNDSLRPGYI